MGFLCTQLHRTLICLIFLITLIMEIRAISILLLFVMMCLPISGDENILAEGVARAKPRSTLDGNVMIIEVWI
jgi:hypothetical protein